MGDFRWYYGENNITFSLYGYAQAWIDNSGKLKKIYSPGKNISDLDYFTIGSDIDDVLRLQGTPDKITRQLLFYEETWWFGKSYVVISHSTHDVIKLDNSSNRLKCK